MNIKDMKASLDYLFQAQITPFVWGHAGIGKSTVVKQYAQEKGYKFFPFYLGTQSDLGDILGLASFVKDKNGSEVATTFATPLWLKDTIEYCQNNPKSGAVIFLDEFNRARRDILNGMFSLALDKTFHTIKLPDNCYIVAAGNPPTDEYYVTDVNETALMARFAHIKLEPTFQEWVTYAKEAHFEPTLVSFLQEQPELIEDAKSAFTLPVKVDRRSYERINRLFKVKTPMSILEQLMCGIIGTERLVAYKLHLSKTDKPLTGEQILNGTGYESAKQWSNPFDIKASLLSISCDNLFDVLKAETGAMNKDRTEHFLQFVEVLPKEVSYPLLKRMLQQDLKVFTALAAKGSDSSKRLNKVSLEARGLK